MANINATIRSLESRGIKYEIRNLELKDGSIQETIVITHIPDIEQEIHKFFSLNTPCFFKGCEELRKEYINELEASGGSTCQTCQKGAIMRKYIPHVTKALKENKNEKDSNIDPGVEAVSDPVETSREGTSQKQPMLRRAWDCIAKVFGNSKRTGN